MWRVSVLLLVARSVAAEPAKTCAPAGGVLFEIDQRATGKRTTATTQLFANGAWRARSFDTDGKLADAEQGCLAPDVLKAIATALRTAPWKTTHAQPTCTLSPRWSTFKWKARSVFTERDCSGDTLDEESAHALDLIEAYIPLVGLDDDLRPRSRHPSPLCRTPGCD